MIFVDEKDTVLGGNQQTHPNTFKPVQAKTSKNQVPRKVLRKACCIKRGEALPKFYRVPQCWQRARSHYLHARLLYDNIINNSKDKPASACSETMKVSILVYLLKHATSKYDRATSIRSFQRVKAYHVEPEALDCLKGFEHGKLVEPS